MVMTSYFVSWDYRDPETGKRRVGRTEAWKQTKTVNAKRRAKVLARALNKLYGKGTHCVQEEKGE